MIMQSFYSAVVAAGADGKVASSFLQKSPLGPKEMNKYPLPLLQSMARYAEDLTGLTKSRHGHLLSGSFLNYQFTDGIHMN